jgi:nitroreductase
MSYKSRKREHKINSLFIERWSPRSFTGEEIPDSVLFAAFEAARWAPSSSNAQPWRFLYAKRGSIHWPAFLDLLFPGNQLWAEKASALIVVASKKTVTRNGQVAPSLTHSFDTGAAWQNFALQAFILGWHTHAMGGFDREKARVALNVPDDFSVEATIAIGKQADATLLPPELQQREAPNDRIPLREIVREGGFPNVTQP